MFMTRNKKISKLRTILIRNLELKPFTNVCTGQYYLIFHYSLLNAVCQYVMYVCKFQRFLCRFPSPALFKTMERLKFEISWGGLEMVLFDCCDKI